MALILGRRIGEEVLLRVEADVSEDELQQLITHGITIRINDLHRGQASLAITAPLAVNIVRNELLDAPHTSTS